MHIIFWKYSFHPHVCLWVRTSADADSIADRAGQLEEPDSYILWAYLTIATHVVHNAEVSLAFLWFIAMHTMGS